MLTGALGVGFGFGLQNIINNFISGLILQFERPIHIDDVLDVDGSSGKVTRIGIRSSTVKTFQGAEVIIPNGSFISGKVVNWTSRSPSAGSNFRSAWLMAAKRSWYLKLLEEAATPTKGAHSPPPVAYFKDSARARSTSNCSSG